MLIIFHDQALSVRTDPMQPTCYNSTTKDEEISKFKSYNYEDSALFCDTTISTTRPFIPESLRKHIFDTFHISHAGFNPTGKLIKSRYYWLNMDKNTHQMARNFVSLTVLTTVNETKFLDTLRHRLHSFHCHLLQNSPYRHHQAITPSNST